MNLQEYASFDAIGLSELIKRREVSPNQLTDVARLAIGKMNAKLNFLAHSVARNDQDSSADRIEHAPFYGVPTLIKDSMLKGYPFELGSRLNQGVNAIQDGEMTRRLKAAGCNIMGISTMPEWGSSPTTESVLYGQTRNPWDLAFSAGGSSGGAAAAVASGAVPFAQASDAGGSIRIPAACCGLVGLKPTRARTPEHQFVPFSPSVSHVITRSVRDTAALLDALHGSELGAIYFAAQPTRRFLAETHIVPRNLRIAYSTSSKSGCAVDPVCKHAVEQVLRVCESMGHTVEEVELPYEWEAFQTAFTTLWAYRHPYSVYLTETQTGKRNGSETREANNLALHDLALKTDMFTFDKCLRYLAQVCVQVGELFNQYDIFVSPVTAKPALRLGEIDSNADNLTAARWGRRAAAEFAPFTPLFNVTGQPAISLPLHQSDTGLPIGVQFVSRHSDESLLLQLASVLEQAMPWSHKKPSVSVFQ